MKVGDMLNLDNQIALFKELRKQDAVWIVSQSLKSMYGVQKVFEEFKRGKPNHEFLKFIVPITHFLYSLAYCRYELEVDGILDIAKWLTRKMLKENLTPEELENFPNTFLDGLYMEYVDYKKCEKEE